MVNLLISDIDGTLLHCGEEKLSDDALALVRRAAEKNVMFAVASGRPYSQLKKLFGADYRKVVFICLDGALVMYRDCVIYKQPVCRNFSKMIFDRNDEAVFYGLRDYLHGDCSGIQGEHICNYGEISGDVYKIALFTPFENDGYPIRVCYNAGGITELVSVSADKGTAARAVMQKFGISPEHAAAVGDGDNDVPLLRSVTTARRMIDCSAALRDLSVGETDDAVEFLNSLI